MAKVDRKKGGERVAAASGGRLWIVARARDRDHARARDRDCDHEPARARSPQSFWWKETIDTGGGLWCSSLLWRGLFRELVALGRLHAPLFKVHATFTDAEARLTRSGAERGQRQRDPDGTVGAAQQGSKSRPGALRAPRQGERQGERRGERRGDSVRANERSPRPISLFQSASRYTGARSIELSRSSESERASRNLSGGSERSADPKNSERSVGECWWS